MCNINIYGERRTTLSWAGGKRVQRIPRDDSLCWICWKEGWL